MFWTIRISLLSILLLTMQSLTAQCLAGDCRDGWGKRQTKIGLYEGDFKDNQFHGSGIMRYYDGSRYEGHWQDGRRHGKGVFYKKNGHVEDGQWLVGRFQEDKLDIWAIVVGIGDYTHMPKLEFTQNDARKVYGFLRSPNGGAIPEHNMRLLLDQEATLLNIQNTVAQVFNQADSNDLIIFYFAGHGQPGAFLPFDFDGQNNMLYHVVLTNLLEDSPAKYKLCIADACHSGGMMLSEVQTRSLGNTQRKIMDFYKSFDKVKGGTAIISSSASEEVSLEADGFKQGVFSYYLIKGMDGHADEDKNGIVTISELYNFTRNNVKKYTMGFQSPMINEEGFDENMPVSIVK